MSDETEDPNSLRGDSRYWTFWIKVDSGRLHSTFYEYRQTFEYKKIRGDSLHGDSFVGITGPPST